MRLTKYEKETIILTSEDDDISVSTLSMPAQEATGRLREEVSGAVPSEI